MNIGKRKVMWSVPLIAAVAVIGALAMFMTLTPNPAQAQVGTPPGNPTELTARPYTEGVPQEQIELKWKAPAANSGGLPTHYRIDVSTNDGVTWKLHMANTGSASTRTILKDFKANTKRTYRVYAINASGTGPVSNMATTTTAASTKPDRPTGLTATAQTADTPATTNVHLTVMLSWNAPADPPGAPVTGYKVEHSDDGSAWTAVVADTEKETNSDGDKINNALTAAMVETTYSTVVPASTRRYYRVSAINSVGTSMVSDTDDATTVIGSVPEQPTNLMAAVSPRSLDVWLYWTPPATEPVGAPVTHYKVEAGITTAHGTEPTDWKTVRDRLPASKDYEATNNVLRPILGSSFKKDAVVAFRVSAVNSAGAGAVSELAYTVVGSDKAPHAVRITTVRHSPEMFDNDGRTGLELTWSAVKNNETTPLDATDYRIEYSDDGADWKLLLGKTETGANTGTQGFLASASAFGWIDSGKGGTARRSGNRNNGGTPDDTSDDTDVDVTITASIDKLAAGEKRYYRVFAYADFDGTNDLMGVPLNESGGTTANPEPPGAPRMFQAQAISRTQIELTWQRPSVTDDKCADDDTEREDDGSECGDSVMSGYRVQVSDTGQAPWTNLGDLEPSVGDEMEVFGDADVASTIKTVHSGLMPGTTKYYRVFALNSSGASLTSNTSSATTIQADFPDAVGGLVAESAGPTSIKLCWNAQSLSPEAALVTMYVIERSPDVKTRTWEKVGEVTTTGTDGEVQTSFVDTGLMVDTKYHYRVFASNLRGTSNESVIDSATTDDAMAPDAPTGVTATAASATQIDLSWTAPADPDGAPVTGYIIERRYTGDMMMDIPSDGYNTAAMGASFAFSNHMEWWETLNCKGMLAAAGSDETMVATPAEGSDQAMYCAHYANTKPTNMAGTITAGSDVDMKIKALFEKRYEVLTGTATSHMDTMLMANTEYTYRVSAVNAKGRSKWSTADKATTQSGNTAPMKVGTIDAMTVTAGQSVEVNVSANFSDADEGDTLTYTATSSMPSYATADIPTGSNMLTIRGVAAGTATVTVTANDGNGGMVSQMFDVTVSDMLTAPSIVSTNPVGSGLVTVTWTSVSGAAGYTILAINLADSSDYETEPINNPDLTTAQIDELTPDVEYLIFVAAFDADDFELSAFRKITAE